MIFSDESVSWNVGLSDALRRAGGESPGGCHFGAPDGRRFFIECRICGFEPGEQQSLPRHACPKCFAHTWHRVIRPGAMVEREAGATSTARLRRLSMVRRG
jgi:hypothetical protein